jgi:hypothetical protein
MRESPDNGASVFRPNRPVRRLQRGGVNGSFPRSLCYGFQERSAGGPSLAVNSIDGRERLHETSNYARRDTEMVSNLTSTL